VSHSSVVPRCRVAMRLAGSTSVSTEGVLRRSASQRRSYIQRSISLYVTGLVKMLTNP